MIFRENLKYIYRKFFRYLPFKSAIYIDFIRTQKKIPNLKKPKTFPEKIQWIKFNGNLNKYKDLVDKYSVREYIKNKIGIEYLNEIYGIYDNAEQIDFEILPNKFVIKLNNGSGYNFICKDKKSLDKKDLINKLNKWIKIDFYKEHKEVQYKGIESKLLIEKYMEDETGELRDYKVFCFDGKPKFIQVDTSRFTNHFQDMYDIQWNKINLTFGYKSSNYIVEKPDKLKEMLYLSEKLSKDIPFVRVDFYYVNNKIYFGELTFTPQNGLISFEPKEKDLEIANMINLEKYLEKG